MLLGRRTARDLALLALGASLYTVAAPPYEWHNAAWVALAPLFLVVHDKTPRAAYAAGFLYGVCFCGGIAYWLYDAIAAYFALGLPLNLLATFLSYGFFVGSYTGLAAAGSCVLMRHRRPVLTLGRESWPHTD
jgi:apolipoprotein N-acyltransferase